MAKAKAERSHLGSKIPIKLLKVSDLLLQNEQTAYWDIQKCHIPQ